MNFPGKIPVICGPTGSGKTAIALAISKKITIEIVSADSGQMIRGLDIGTAKPTKKEQKQARFHLIDIIRPGQDYSAFKFIEDAEKSISEIIERQKLPVVVGGTGLYIKALTKGIVNIASENTDIRTRLENEMEELGTEAMHQKLKNVDRNEASKIHPNNKFRVVRALEIYYLTGIPKSKFIKSAAHKKSRFDYRFFCLMPPRTGLYKTINERADRMIENGLMGELTGLINRGLGAQVKKMNVIGYNELFEHIKGNITLDEAVLLIKQNSRRYAKRQFTWFRHQLKGGHFTSANDLIMTFLAAYSKFAWK